MERFDEIFLFITSVLGLFFSLLYALLGYQEIAIGFLPLLIIGLAIPIYIGYIRGAILLDMLEERIRGWIYFLSGVAIYLGSAILLIVDELLTTFGFPAKPFQATFYVGGCLILGYFLGRGRLHRWFCRSIHKAFNHEITELTEKIYRETSSSAHLIGIMFFASLTISLSETFEPVLVSIMICFILLGVFYFVSSELYLRKWVNLVRFSDFVEIESEKIRPYISRRVRNILTGLFIAILFLIASLGESIPRSWLIGLLTIGSLDAALVRFLTRTKYTPVRKKDVPKEIELKLTELLNRITRRKKN